MAFVQGNPDTIYTDVLVIGSGGAALRAALAAQDEGVEVTIAVKGIFAKSGASSYSVAEIGAFNVPDGAADAKDCPDQYLKDILDAGLGMSDPRLSCILAEEAVDAMKYLEQYGVEFERDKDDYLAYQACFSTRPRSHVIKNHFKPIVKALGQEASRRNIRVIDRVMITDLLVQSGQCFGAYAVDFEGRLLVIRAKATILTTGGASQMFAQNLYPPDITGDGYAMAYRAGAHIVNMEFMQAGVSLVEPFLNLFNSWLWEAFPSVTNKDRDAFISRYLPSGVSHEAVLRAKARHFPFSTRDLSRYIEIAIQKEINIGNGTEHGGVYLDFMSTDFSRILANQSSDIGKMWNMTYEWYLKKNVDLYRQSVEVTCSAHAVNGGVRTNGDAESTVKGLFAAGEVAGGPHGADRLGGNMSVTCQVFGRRAGRAAAKHAKVAGKHPELARCIDLLKESLGQIRTNGTVRPSKLKKRLQAASNRHLLIARHQSGLSAFMHDMDELEHLLYAECQIDTPRDFIRALELKNMLAVGRMMATAASLRTESRGSHYREDYPEMSKEFEKNIILDSTCNEGYFIAKLAEL